MSDEIDRPVPHEIETYYGSDAIATMMRRLGTPYVALNPGSSFRGLHDSLVNHLGNRDPQMLLCLHEEHAVAIAHGWAKVTESPLSVILHANVGLMHAAMALYNAWCDRVPMMVFGATGPVDAARRRPWIDWLHTSRDQAAVVRPFVKWDDQPSSLEASLDSMMRASRITVTAPMAPTYVCFDVSVQEQRLDALPALPSPEKHALPRLPGPSEADVSDLLAFLEAARSPVFLMGRVSRDQGAWDRRVALAERFCARVVTDIKTAAAFPTRHSLHVGQPGYFLSEDAKTAVRDADLVISFDFVDPAGALAQAGVAPGNARIVNVTPEPMLQNGWSLDHQAMPPSDLTLLSPPDPVIEALCARLALPGPAEAISDSPLAEINNAEPMTIDTLADILAASLDGHEATYMRLTLSWNGAKCDFRGPLDYLGYDGGAGIGSGPGMAVGSALALNASGRLPVAVLGDGDFLMGATALWTAVHHRVPMLIVVANNRSYFNDEVHQERVARDRGRPVENKGVGQVIQQPDIDIAGMARSQGALGFGPVKTAQDACAILGEAVAATAAGSTVVVDMRIVPGYSAEMSKGMTTEK